jgi:hypothetical protein
MAVNSECVLTGCVVTHAGGPGGYQGDAGAGYGAGAPPPAVNAPYAPPAAVDVGYGANSGYTSQPPSYGAPPEGGYDGVGGGAPQGYDGNYAAANGGYNGGKNTGYNSMPPGKGMHGPPGHGNWGGGYPSHQRYAPY